MADMLELTARLEAAEVGSRRLDGDIHRLISPDALLMTDSGSVGPIKREAKREPIGTLHSVPGEVIADCIGAEPYTTSLDAALALAERVLPGWRAQMLQHTGYWRAHLAAPDGRLDDDKTGRASEAPLALCIAILKAKAQGEGG
ncbi:hypothetical protein [Brevundimonas bullata]